MYSSLLLDYHQVIKPNEKEIKPFLNKINFKGFYPSFYKERSGIVIVISQKEFEVLDKSGDKIRSLNSLNILAYTSLIYDQQKGIILGFVQDLQYLPKILEALLMYLPNGEYIFAVVEKGGIEEYLSLGFKNPFYSEITPLGDKIAKSICLTRKNEYIGEESKGLSISKTRDEIIYLLNPAITCTFNFKINEDSKKHLEKMATQAGSSLNSDGSITQKEVSGGFKIIQTEMIRDSMIFTLAIDKRLTTYNQEESAIISPCLYNFHTHPKKAYLSHKVKIAWPSPDDYSAFLNSVKIYQTIFHLLASIEGYYIISLSSYWAINFDSLDVSSDWINSQYNFRYNLTEEGWTPKKYIKEVNEIVYQNGKTREVYPLFKVKFSEWNDLQTFKVAYPRFSGNCFYSQEALEAYRKFYL